MKQKLIQVFNIILVLSFIGNINISKKVDFDNLEAEKVLKETYEPLEKFAEKLVLLKDEKFFSLPECIQNEKDFISLFTGKMKAHNAKSFYKTLVLEKNDELCINACTYIPSIYTPEAKVTRSYIKESEKIFSKIFRHNGKKKFELIIKEKWMDNSKRTNYYIKKGNDEWILDYANGISKYGFVNRSDNPWNIYYKDNEIMKLAQ